MFTKGKTPETSANANAKPKTPAPAPDAARRPAAGAARSAPSLISADVKMRGSFESAGEVQIDGQIEGDVKATALTIGDSGAVIGEVEAETVTVRGKVKGTIRSKKVHLCTGSNVEGDITHA
ncbi:MAG: polymer-forming cytoskeletal protein, partial [Pseudomonadota bacterium]